MNAWLLLAGFVLFTGALYALAAAAGTVLKQMAARWTGDDTAAPAHPVDLIAARRLTGL